MYPFDIFKELITELDGISSPVVFFIYPWRALSADNTIMITCDRCSSIFPDASADIIMGIICATGRPCASDITCNTSGPVTVMWVLSCSPSLATISCPVLSMMLTMSPGLRVLTDLSTSMCVSFLAILTSMRNNQLKYKITHVGYLVKKADNSLKPPI